VLALVALAGCGSSSSSSSTPSPVSAELSYFPAGSPLVLTLATAPNSSGVSGAQGLIGHFPLAGFGLQVLQSRLSQAGLSYTSDIKPLLGNPAAFGVASTTIGSGTSSPFLLAWVTRNGARLSSLFRKLFPAASSLGHRDGSSLYQASGLEAAIDGATLVLGSPSAVPAALDRHAHGGGITASQLSAATSGLPENPLVELYGSLAPTLSSATAARRVPWVGAIRSYAAALSASASGLSLRFRLDTGARSLTSQQIPIAAGTTAPQLAGTLPIVTGVHDPAQIVTFAEGAAQAADPTGYASFLKHVAKLKSQTGVDLNSLASLLTGDLVIESDTHTTIGRAQVSNPSAAAQTLTKLLHAPAGVFKHGATFTRAGGGFYAIHNNGVIIHVGVVGSQLVAGTTTPAALKAYAAAPASTVAGAQGSVAFRISLLQLLKLTLHQAPPAYVQSILNSLGDITGWASASPGALTGSASLAIR
jgi:hypothetical protein